MQALDRELDLDANAPQRASRTDRAAFQLRPYIPARQHDWVRTIVTVGLLAALGGIIFWACRQSISPAAQWSQTKEMLQILLPAITGLLGSVIGFYFGTGAAFNAKQGNQDR